MDPTRIYAASMGGILCLNLLVNMIRFLRHRILFVAELARLTGWVFHYPTYVFLKYLAYPYLLRRTTILGPFSRYDVALQIIYWGGTAVCNILRVNTVQVAGTRAGNLAVINFALLALGSRFRLVSDILGVNMRSYTRMHRMVGLMTCLQSATHIILRLRGGFSFSSPLQLYGFLTAVGIASAILTAMLKWLLSEIIGKVHYALGIFILVSLWRHLHIQNAFSQVYVLVGTITLTCTTIIHWAVLVLHNISTSRVGCRAQISRLIRAKSTKADEKESVAALLAIPVLRPFKVRAGMVVYVYMPGLGFWSLFQTHPFTIAWWENDEGGKAKTIWLLVRERAGFTKRMMHFSDRPILTFIDGPYGLPSDLVSYDRVLMVATGVGIAAQISYIKELVELTDDKCSTRNIYVVWEVEEGVNQAAVYDWMNQLLLLDRDKDKFMLKYGLYVSSDNKNSVPTAWNGGHDRIWIIPKPMNLWKLIGDYFWAGKGKGLITVAANNTVRDGIIDVASKRMTHPIDVLDLSF